MPPHLFRVFLLELLNLPLPIMEAVCNRCHEPLDAHGRHRAAWTRSGRVRKRATPTERMLHRICREAGARVKYNAFVRDMNLDVRADDERRIEVLAQDLPCFNGAKLAVDVTRFRGTTARRRRRRCSVSRLDATRRELTRSS